MNELRQAIMALYKAKTGKTLCERYLNEIESDVLAWVRIPSVLQQALMESPLWLSLTGDDARTV
ncbi:hypothetical protein ACQ9LF_04800 [Anaerohalosphaeraceae bacterium U12dextr]|jgi:hypothetical protein